MILKRSSIILALMLAMLLFMPNGAGAQSRPELTVLFDNYPGKEGLLSGNGFACLIRGTEKTILFDTGGDKDILLHNMKMLKVDPGEIDQIVISHYHDDHTAGLLSLLEQNPQLQVFIPDGFADLELFNRISAVREAKTVTVRQPMTICRGVYSTGPMQGMGLSEQSLVIDGKSGLILLCGCAHPGITKIIEESMRIFNKPVIFVFGGFHYKGASETRILEAIQSFASLGVVGIGGSHCTGDEMMRSLRTFYGKTYIPMVVGTSINLR